MTSRGTPWDDIANPDADYNVRQITRTDLIPLYWGKDAEGHCLFIMELNGDHGEQFRRNTTSVHGIKADLRMLDAMRSQGLVITLEQQIDRDLFLGLCESLVASLREVKDASTALAVALTHIKRWKAFMAGRKNRLLSVEEIRGLYAELQFLRGLYRDRLTGKSAVEAWCGPDGIHQDFIFGNTAVEIKALSGRERRTVRISSEDQLEAVCDNLFLTVYRLSDMPDSERAMSLNGFVTLVESELSDAEAKEDLSARLAAYGYVEMREYDQPKLQVTGQHTFKVEGNFPRIIRSGLPEGIARVGYEIELEKLAPFECDAARIWES